MYFSNIAVGLAGVVAMANAAQKYPPSTMSQGVRLVAHLKTNTTSEFKYINGLKSIRPGHTVLAVGEEGNTATVFYTNGTQEQYEHGQTALQAFLPGDGTPHTVRLGQDDQASSLGELELQLAYLDINGNGETPMFSNSSQPIKTLAPMGWMLCSEPQSKISTLKIGHFWETYPDCSDNFVIYPECAELGEPKDKYGVLYLQCYQNVSAINWDEY
ncbi:hypothetical protein PT974_04536 [Cladobotryum mycophilum]|uniref:Uncharacterized protein n=1 Tax=Cladobotryum mycophilum TaxID=491253 RepID=A0ABR0SVS0_9HYPO